MSYTALFVTLSQHDGAYDPTFPQQEVAMVFDAERFHAQQQVATQRDALPSAAWIDRCGQRLSRYAPDTAPAIIVAQARVLWLTHWCEEPVAAADAMIMKRLCIDVEGATAEELERGLAAAVAVLAAAGVTPQRASLAHWQREGWDTQGFPDTDKPSTADLRAAQLWDDAELAAAAACCQGWTDSRPQRATLGLAGPV